MASDQKTGAGRALEPGQPVTSDSNVEERFPVLDRDPKYLKTIAADAVLSEEVALSLLKRPDLPAETLEQLAKNRSAAKHRKVRLALVGHPKTPRRISLPLLRQLYTFDLM